MKIKKHYSHKRKVVERTAVLKRGEQYKLMSDNKRALVRKGVEHKVDWIAVFED